MVELENHNANDSDKRLVAHWENHQTKAYGGEDPCFLKEAAPDIEINIIVIIAFSLPRETSDTIGEKWEHVQKKRDL